MSDITRDVLSFGSSAAKVGAAVAGSFGLLPVSVGLTVLSKTLGAVAEYTEGQEQESSDIVGAFSETAEALSDVFAKHLSKKGNLSDEDRIKQRNEMMVKFIQGKDIDSDLDYDDPLTKSQLKLIELVGKDKEIPIEFLLLMKEANELVEKSDTDLEKIISTIQVVRLLAGEKNINGFDSVFSEWINNVNKKSQIEEYTIRNATSLSDTPKNGTVKKVLQDIGSKASETVKTFFNKSDEELDVDNGKEQTSLSKVRISDTSKESPGNPVSETDFAQILAVGKFEKPRSIYNTGNTISYEGDKSPSIPSNSPSSTKDNQISLSQ